MALILTIGCNEPTQVLVEIRADVGTRMGAENLQITVHDDRDQERLSQRIPVQARDLLATIPLIPQGDDASRGFRVRAQLFDGSETVIHEAELQDGEFVAGRIERLVLRLGAPRMDAGPMDAGILDTGSDGPIEDGPIEDRPPNDAPRDTTDAADAPSCPLCIDEVSAGAGHTCARRRDAVYCFGGNANGQLGVPFDRFGTEPRLVPGTFDSVSVGPFSTSTLRGGELIGWGNGNFVPLSVSALTFRQAVGANQRRCGLVEESGAVVCYGSDGSLQQTIDTHAFEQVSISARHGCGVERVTQQIRCWGLNTHGQLGNGRAPDTASEPSRIVPSDRFLMVDAGSVTANPSSAAHTCGVSVGGMLLCWGNNEHGQLGRGSLVSDPSADPAPVRSTGLNWESVSVGGSTTCAIDETSNLYCWGDNRQGQLGVDSTADNMTTPTQVEGEYRMVSVGTDHVCAISTTDGELYCWGNPMHGKTGRAGPDPIRAPARVRITE